MAADPDPATPTLVITDARLAGDPTTPVTVTLDDRTILEVAAGHVEATSAAGRWAVADIPTIAAEGGLVTAPFVNAHMHLCKVFTLDLVGDGALRAYSAPGMADANTAIDLAREAKSHYDVERIAENATQVLLDGLAHGVTHVRAFADVDSRAGLRGVEGVLAARDRVAGLVDVEVVAFPQDGIVRDPGSRDLVARALELGADVVGGIPWIEASDADQQRHVDLMLDLAVAHDVDVAMLVDDSGDARLDTTRMLAEAAIQRGWEGRVAACHARAIGLYDAPRLADLIALSRDAGLGFVANPHTGPLHLPIFELAAAGLWVALGQDDIVDAYYPFGQHSMLEVAFLAAHVLHRYDLADAEQLLGMVTAAPASVVGRPTGPIAAGAPAELVVLRGATPREALRLHAAPRAVVRGGRVVASSRAVTTIAEAPGQSPRPVPIGARHAS